MSQPSDSAGPSLWFDTCSDALVGNRRRSMRRAPRLTPAGMRGAWTLEPLPLNDPVPEEWVIPPRQGPLAITQGDLLMVVDDAEVVIEVHPPAAPVAPVIDENFLRLRLPPFSLSTQLSSKRPLRLSAA